MTSRRDPHALAREAEAKLAEIQGVQNARLTIDRRGEISEVHVVADTSRRGKELVRDIETVLKACFEISVDHRRISVARMGEEEETPLPGERKRVRLAGVGVRMAEGSGTAQVDLARNGVESTGESSGAGSGGAWLRLVAGATLNAVDRFLPTGCGLSLGTVAKGHLGDHEVVMVGVDYTGERGPRELVGCALLGEDMHRSIARATLDAINRVLDRTDLRAESVTFLEPPLQR